MDDAKPKVVAVIVAHPDDETLWAGGTILNHPSWKWFIISLTRKSDIDRSGKFYKALKILGAEGIMGDLDDGPEQKPLLENELEEIILSLLPQVNYDLIITHNPLGEYTRHLRHEETAKAVISLWNSGKITAKELWTFAYEDGGKQYLPRAVSTDTLFEVLPDETWQKKYHLITENYGFNMNSWEAETTPKEEAFKIYTNSVDAMHWAIKERIL
jgi:LmbE family N-acetylglucosaminyl deacetylase